MGKILKRTQPGAECSMEIVSVIKAAGFGIFSLTIESVTSFRQLGAVLVYLF